MNEIALKESWNIVIIKNTVYLFTDTAYFSGSFKQVEDHMSERGLLSRKDFIKRVWVDGFLSGKGDVITINNG